MLALVSSALVSSALVEADGLSGRLGRLLGELVSGVLQNGSELFLQYVCICLYDMRQELVNLEVLFDLTAMNRPSVEQVRAVISALYNDSDPGGKEKASQWLQELQRSVCTATF